MSGGPLVTDIEVLGFANLDRVLPSGIRDEGLICPLISASVNDAKEFTISWGRMLPGQHHVKHHHAEVAEFYVFVKGQPLVHIGSEVVRVHPGQAVYIPPGTLHGVTNDTDEVIDFVAGINRVGQWDFIPDE